MTATDRLRGLEKFSRLEIVRELEPERDAAGRKYRMVLARCECGDERAYRRNNVRSGNSKSCGCHKRDVAIRMNKDRAERRDWVVAGDIARTEINGVCVMVDAADLEIVRPFCWYLDSNGYARSSACGAMHRLVLGVAKGNELQVDHIHHVKTDNRKSQLRLATRLQNHRNSRGKKSRRSLYKGVSIDAERGLFKAQIGIAGQTFCIGRFSTEIDAARAYDAAAKKYFGEFAYLNLPDSQQGATP